MDSKEKEKILKDTKEGAKEHIKVIDSSIENLKNSKLIEKEEMKKSYENMREKAEKVIENIENQLND